MKCPKCGTEMEGNPPTCPSCGNNPGDSGRRGRILALVIGVILLFFSIALIVGGVVLVLLGSGLADEEGYRVSKTNEVAVDTYAGIVEGIEVDLDEYLPPFLRWIGTKDLAIVRIRATGTNSSKELFVGVAKEKDAMAYFNNLQFDVAIHYEWRVSPWNVSLDIGETGVHWGEAPSQPPMAEPFWVASGRGDPVATLYWTPEQGTYWVAVMNADGSSGLEAGIQLGARFPVLGRLFRMMLVLGLILGVGGAVLIYFGYVRRG